MLFRCGRFPHENVFQPFPSFSLFLCHCNVVFLCVRSNRKIEWSANKGSLIGFIQTFGFVFTKRKGIYVLHGLVLCNNFLRQKIWVSEFPFSPQILQYIHNVSPHNRFCNNCKFFLHVGCIYIHSSHNNKFFHFRWQRRITRSKEFHFSDWLGILMLYIVSGLPEF